MSIKEATGRGSNWADTFPKVVFDTAFRVESFCASFRMDREIYEDS